MKLNTQSLALAFGAFVLSFASTPAALASCASVNVPLAQPSALHMHLGSAGLLPAALLQDDQRDEPGDRDGVSIVGMWHVVFTGQTMFGGPYTLPQPFDNSVVVWHSDGTEIMNSARPAQDGNFCLGVWKQTGRRQYLLNHIPWQGNDPTGAPQDGAQLIEQVTLSPDGRQYSGTFTFQAYDSSGNPTLALTGTIAATRITPDTPFSSLL